jgi:hypothetical protein
MLVSGAEDQVTSSSKSNGECEQKSHHIDSKIAIIELMHALQIFSMESMPTLNHFSVVPFECKTDTVPILMHQMGISTN